MNAIPEAELEGYDRDKRLERVLNALEGKSAFAVDLMQAIGIPAYVTLGPNGPTHVRPQTAYVEFVNILIRVERFFALHGFALRKSGGTPFDEIWIEPAHAGSPSNSGRGE